MANDFYMGGKRFGATPLPSLDEMAQQQGHNTFDEWMQEDPVMAQQFAFAHGNGATYQQAAASDDLSTGKLLGILAATAAGGAFADWAAAGSAGAGAAGAGAGGGGGAASGGALPASIGSMGVESPSTFLASSPGLYTGSLGGLSATAPAMTELAPVVSETGGGGLSGTLGNVAKYGKLAQTAGSAIGKATSAAAANRGATDTFNLDAARLALENNQLGLQGYEASSSAQSAYQNELLARAKQEEAERAAARHSLYLQGVANGPRRNPFSNRPEDQPPALSDAYRKALDEDAARASALIGTDPRFTSASMAMPTYSPYVQPPFTPPRQTHPGTLETVGNWLGPTLSIAGSIAGSGAF